MNRSKQTKRSALALAILLAIAAPTHALAQDASPQTLEARIAQLEQMVQMLKSELDAQKAADAEAASQAQDAAAAQAAQRMGRPDRQADAPASSARHHQWRK